MSYTARQVLLSLCMHFEGDYSKMLDELSTRRHSLSNEEMDGILSQKMESSYCCITDSDYPACFKEVVKPPLVFFYYGDISLLSKKYRLTCVGTRKPTIYQNETCYRFISEMEEKMKDEVVIVSGMAKGLDQTCMKAAMTRGAPLVSIIGSGIDDPYPEDNGGIYEYCKSGKGLVISEYPLKMKAKPENFLFRNRLLAAAGKALFVGGAKKRSGTSSTVSYALEDGKNVMALPCNVSGDDLTNLIIKDGAYPVLDSDDLVNEIKETK